MKKKTNIRKELNLVKERRGRHIKNLIEETILNVLAEQQQAPAAPPPQQQVEQLPPPVATPDNNAQADMQAEQKFSVDDLIEALNVIRGGRSFTDPEVYGRLVTFFKQTSDEQITVLEALLTQIADLVTGVENEEEYSDNENNNEGSAPPASQVQPGGAPQQSAPMPGAQTSAGAAGVGVA